MSENLGKETIDLYNTSETRSNQKSFGLNHQKLGKELMSRDKLKVMDGGKCILEIRGARPFYSDKFDITKHKNYKLLSDYNKKNTFNIEKYLKRRDKVNLKEEMRVKVVFAFLNFFYIDYTTTAALPHVRPRFPSLNGALGR